MPSGQNKRDNKWDDQLLIMEATIEATRKDSDEKTKRLTEYLTVMIISITYKIKLSKS